MLEQAHLEGTSTDTDFQQSEHQLPHLASYVYGLNCFVVVNLI